MGATSSSVAYNASPVQPSISVGGFVVDANEVTVARFRRFWNVGAPGPTRPIVYPSASLSWTGPVTEPATATVADSTHCNWTASVGSREAHPINCIDWATAQAFCVWDGGRLPTEAEWEFTARGRAVASLGVPRLYPWGDTDPTTTCDRAQWNLCTGDDGAGTRRVGSFASSGGIFDLAGNVWEWTADRYADYTDTGCWGAVSRSDPLCVGGATDPRTFRGGAWDGDLLNERSAGRNSFPPATRHRAIGFRCVRRATTAPRQLVPLSTVTVTSRRPSLRWELASGTDGARVQICSDRACTSVEQTIDVTGSSATPTTILSPGVHFWRLFGRMGTTVDTVPSPTWEFFVSHHAVTVSVDTSSGSIADFNGDGYPDLVVGASTWMSNTGRAYVYLGGPTGIAATPAVTLTGPDGTGGWFGNVCSAGDVNGDGYGDLAVGASDAGSGPGRVYIYLGGPAGIASTAATVLNGSGTPGSNFGWTVVALGDVNGDGYGDLAVGDNTCSPSISTGVFLGTAAGLATAPAFTLAGLAVASGDVNGDSLPDLSCQSGYYSTDLYMGTAGGISTTSTSGSWGAGYTGGLGYSIGDVNGDGYGDMVNVDCYSCDRTQAFVYYGSSMGLGSTTTTIPGPGDGVVSDGASADSDFNGDGYDDVVVGESGYGSNTGRVRVFFGGSPTVAVTPNVTITGPDGAGGYFSPLAHRADLNNDGYDDLVIGARGAMSNTGKVYIFYGGPSGIGTSPSVTLTGPDGTGNGFGSSGD